MKPGLKLIFVTLPLVAVGLGILAYIISNRSLPEQNTLTERPTAVRFILASKQQLAPRITGYGLVRPSHVYEAIAQVGGTAEYVNPLLEKGGILAAGTVLLRLSEVDFNLAIAQAKANIRAAEAKLAELKVSEQNQNAALEIEKKVLEIKENDVARIEKLVVSGTASDAARDAAQAAWLTQRQKVQNLENTLALLPTQQQVQKEQIAVYEVSLKTAELDLARATLTLPFTARVAETTVEVGQFVRAGQVAAVLDGVNSAEIDAQVSIADMLGLLQSSRPRDAKPGMDPAAMTRFLRNLGLGVKVNLRLGDQVLSWSGDVDRISDTIDQKSGTIGVIIQVDKAYASTEPGKRPPLTKGMFVEVELSGPPIEGIVVPRSALRGSTVLLATDENRLTSVPVTPKLLLDEVALIGDGLEPGSRVVVSSPTPTIEGMLLELTEDTVLQDTLARAGQTQ